MSTITKRDKSDWNDIALYWDSFSGEFGSTSQRKLIFPVLQNIIKSYPVIDPKILDIGCGNGWFLRNLALVGYKNLVGIDPAPSMIDFSSKYKKNKPTYANIRYFASSLQKYTALQKTKFDILTSILTSHSIENIKLFFRDARKTLKKQGVLLICIEHPYFSLVKEVSSDHHREWIEKKATQDLPDFGLYEAGQKQKIYWTADKITIKFFRTLHDYSFYLRDNGFLIRQIHEISSFYTDISKNYKIKYPKFIVFETKKEG